MERILNIDEDALTLLNGLFTVFVTLALLVGLGIGIAIGFWLF